MPGLAVVDHYRCVESRVMRYREVRFYCFIGARGSGVLLSHLEVSGNSEKDWQLIRNEFSFLR